MTSLDAVQQATAPATAQRVALLGASLVPARDRVPAGPSGRRAVARPDEDAVTLAAEAAAMVLPPSLARLGAVVLATTTPPYARGGSVQTLVEVLGLQDDVFALELSASRRDGLAAIRLAAGLATADAPVLVCAAHAEPTDAGTGDGAVALLLGATGEEGPAGLATLTPAAVGTVELRDRWRLAGEDADREADRSFVQAIGTDQLGRALLARVPAGLRAAPVVVGPDPRGSATLERELGGPGDAVAPATGVLGAAHPLARLVAGLDAPRLVLSVAGGLGEAVHVEPNEAGPLSAAAAVDAVRDSGRETDRPLLGQAPVDFNPYASRPRSWRDRGSDLRLEGLLGDANAAHPVPVRSRPTGTVIAWTRDHVYPAAPTTELVAVRVGERGQFYGQVAMGESVAIGDEVELVFRRLHTGGHVLQYFWKVRPCR